MFFFPSFGLASYKLLKETSQLNCESWRPVWNIVFKCANLKAVINIRLTKTQRFLSHGFKETGQVFGRKAKNQRTWQNCYVWTLKSYRQKCLKFVSPSFIAFLIIPIPRILLSVGFLFVIYTVVVRYQSLLWVNAGAASDCKITVRRSKYCLNRNF